MRILGFLLLAFLVLYGVAIAAMALFQRQLMYPGAFLAQLREPLPTPPGVEAVNLRTRDGETLHGFWAPPRRGCGVVVSFHGNGSRPEWHAERFADAPWREAGWGVLAIAYRGYAGSTGAPSEEGLIEDGLTAYRFAEGRAPGAPILLHGHSLGAAIAIAVAERHAAMGLYLEAPFDSMSRLVRQLYPYLPTSLLLKDTYRSDRRITSGTEPVLIVQGTEDDIVLPERARALASAAGARARIDVIAGDHVSIIGSRDAEAEAFFRARIGEACAAEPAH